MWRRYEALMINEANECLLKLLGFTAENGITFIFGSDQPTLAIEVDNALLDAKMADTKWATNWRVVLLSGSGANSSQVFQRDSAPQKIIKIRLDKFIE